MPHPIPIIGLLGGIASGKSFWARAFASAGCVVVDADAIVAGIYRRSEVLECITGWWGPGMRLADGSLNRSAVAKVIFGNAIERQRLEALIHPLVLAEREEKTAQAFQSSQTAAKATPSGRIPAVVWDIPLLLETGLGPECDALVFVDAPLAVREARARERGWTSEELAKREAAQIPLADKRSAARYVLPPPAKPGEIPSTASDAVAQILFQLAAENAQVGPPLPR